MSNSLDKRGLIADLGLPVPCLPICRFRCFSGHSYSTTNRLAPHYLCVLSMVLRYQFCQLVLNLIRVLNAIKTVGVVNSSCYSCVCSLMESKQTNTLAFKLTVPEQTNDRGHKLAPRNPEMLSGSHQGMNSKLSVASRRRRFDSRTTPS